MTINVEEVSVSSWVDFVQYVTTEFLGRWHFRGCLDNHNLESTLERAAKHLGIPSFKLQDIERGMLRDFKRAFPLKAEVEAPPNEADLDWLALMQHHGAPTRLLDWTYSPFVAAFFALDMLLKSPDKDRKAAIWALSVDPVDNDIIKNMIPAGELSDHFEKFSKERDGASFRAVFFEAKPPLVFAMPVNPYKLNERLIVQQGLFLCSGDVTRPFEDNLAAVPAATEASNLKKIILPRSILSEGFVSLRRMNISAASLFPGIDGYARSQHHTLDFLHSVPPFDGTVY